MIPRSGRDAPIRILCVDDHTLVRDGISLMVRLQNDMRVVAVAATGEQGVDLFRRHRPDITLMDLELPTMSGIDAINAIKVDEPNARVIVLTMHDEEEMIYRALQAGAATYLLKDTLLKDLVRVIREVHAGNSPLPDDVAAHLERRSSEHALTPRETAVIELIGRGMTDRTIATVLNISEKTVHVHVRNCLDKLGVDNRTAAARVALRRGIVQLK